MVTKLNKVVDSTMITRKELDNYLENTFKYAEFDDYCKNGLQIEGKNKINKIVFGVSFNLPLLNCAIEENADAIIVHHGFFGKDFFSITGLLKTKVKLLLDTNISLFGIHLPLDAHPEIGNNAILLSYLKAKILEPFGVGFIAKNSKNLSIKTINDTFNSKLRTKGKASPFLVDQASNFKIYENGPKIPKTIACVSGGASYLYEKAINLGVDTFITGEVKEQTAAFSWETKTNFMNIGHYWSEKAGILALQKEIQNNFDIETNFIDIENDV